jgi:hypothetical protein
MLIILIYPLYRVRIIYYPHFYNRPAASKLDNACRPIPLIDLNIAMIPIIRYIYCESVCHFFFPYFRQEKLIHLTEHKLDISEFSFYVSYCINVTIEVEPGKALDITRSFFQLFHF